MPPRLLHVGAEAEVRRGDWCRLDAVFKVRVPLRYRLPQLDVVIRRHRTLREADMLRRARRAGVATPRLYCVEPAAATLVMEYVKGRRLKEAAESKGHQLGAFGQLGQAVGLLHRSGVVHGDLTTANVILRSGSCVLVDFGLSHQSFKVEDHAVDLRLIKESITGAHNSISRGALDRVFRGYSKAVGPRRAAVVMKQLRAIEMRGRYARVE